MEKNEKSDRNKTKTDRTNRATNAKVEQASSHLTSYCQRSKKPTNLTSSKIAKQNKKSASAKVTPPRLFQIFQYFSHLLGAVAGVAHAQGLPEGVIRVLRGFVAHDPAGVVGGHPEAPFLASGRNIGRWLLLVVLGVLGSLLKTLLNIKGKRAKKEKNLLFCLKSKLP